MTYASQQDWRTIQTFLPEQYRLTDDTTPKEEWWDHLGHRIHLDTYRRPEAPVRVILFHGIGTNGRQMSTILGRPLADLGYETISVDMPTYGVTEVAEGALVTYDDWVQIGSDLIDKELGNDDRPIVLYGLSAGGMETYHVASRNGRVAGIVGMTFLDQESLRVRMATSFDPMSGVLGAGMMKALSRTRLRRARVPMHLVTKMRTLVNDRAARRACYADKTSAGNSATVAFLSSYLNFEPDVRPSEFDVCPILLTQPAADRWTPLKISEPFLEQIRKVPVKTVMLENAGHYPLEQPGLDQMVTAVESFCADVARGVKD